MSFDLGLNSVRITHCHKCHDKPMKTAFCLKEIDKKISFCSMKCMQGYKIELAIRNSKKHETQSPLTEQRVVKVDRKKAWE